MTVPRQSHEEASYPWPPVAARGAHASLSVVLLSTGDPHVLQGSISALAPRCKALGAELIIVGADAEIACDARLHQFSDLRFVRAPESSTLARMRDVGMAQASGDIVALREDVAVGDGSWLEVFAYCVGATGGVAARSLAPAHGTDRPADLPRPVADAPAIPRSPRPDPMPPMGVPVLPADRALGSIVSRER